MPARAVVSQFFVTEAENEYVIRANSAIMKCKIPSFVSEFVQVDQWIADDGTVYTAGKEYVVQQFYETRVIDEFVLRGNTATLKCLVPSFVADFVDVIEWLAVEDGSTYTSSNQDEKVVGQYFEVQVYDQFAIRGNAAIFKCQVPSFVADHVDVVGWIDSNGGSYVADDQSYVVGQRYAVNVMDEHVLRGNAAIIKCHIPSFVAEFVEVDSWIEDNTTDIYPRPDYDGKYLVLPSGELHIRDVGPEDGYKTYQCRTKHRLTGETRLSATKGRLVITEPVGSVRPKFPSMDNINGLTTSSSDNIPLLCPAQGFPVPSHRTIRENRTWYFTYSTFHLSKSPWEAYVPRFLLQMTSVASEHWLTVRKPCCAQHRGSPFLCTGREQTYVSEPVGSVRPKFPTIDDSRSFRTTMDGSVTLLCPAQGFPVPLYKNFGLEIRVFYCALRVSVSNVLVELECCSYTYEPVGSVRPKFPAMSNINGFMTYQGGSMTLLCAAQGFPVPSHRIHLSRCRQYYYYYDYYYPEPVGSVRPKFPTIDDTRGFRTIKDGSVTLACSAQGFPVPVHKTSRQYKAQIPDDREFAYLYDVYSLSQRIAGFTMSGSSLSCSSLQILIYIISLDAVFDHTFKYSCCFQYFVEPVASTRPKFSSLHDSQTFKVSLGGAMTLLCPAQGFPVPLHRTGIQYSSTIVRIERPSKVQRIFLKKRYTSMSCSRIPSSFI
ncbi:hypothetical protein M0804_000243 [Polistes exclamans]|nr:hypothetical protein M0804_000243 [Polistes exclamans]